VTATGRLTQPEAETVEREGQRITFDEAFWTYGANASLLLFDGWGNVSGYRQATRARSAADLRLQDSRQAVALEAERRFFEVLKARALLGVQEEAVNLSGEQLRKTGAMKDLGAATRADVLKGEVDHANNRLEALRAQRNLEVARAALATYLGVSGAGLELAEEDLSVDLDMELDAAIQRAEDVNPELTAAQLSADATAAGVTSAKAERWPSLSAFYGASYSAIEAFDLSDSTVTTSYGLSLNFTLFDGFLTKSRIRRAESDLLTARRAAESTERDVQFDVRQAWLDLEIAREAILVSEESVRSSEEDLRLAQERFKIGEGTILDVIDAQVNLTRSRSNLVNATYERRLAVTALRDAIGDVDVRVGG
jgi:outer membrane protein TolC